MLTENSDKYDSELQIGEIRTGYTKVISHGRDDSKIHENNSRPIQASME